MVDPIRTPPPGFDELPVEDQMNPVTRPPLATPAATAYNRPRT